MSLPPEIKPTKKQRVMDLAREAGLDVGDWANYRNGASNPAANPKYCYEWALVEPNKLVVLNLWYELMREVAGNVEQHLNLRMDARREEGATRRGRRKRMEEAIWHAYQTSLPIRVIVLDGNRRSETGNPARVNTRALDPTPWGVASYNQESGDILLRRGLSSKPYVDQFSLRPLPEGDTGRHESQFSRYNRSPEVREHVLIRAGGKCELCESLGFVLPNGSIYLETHHVIPLAEGGGDSVLNVAALCPNDHREAHYGRNKGQIRSKLLSFLAQKYVTR